jgi:transcriptional regulator with XRE-family HTH domain
MENTRQNKDEVIFNTALGNVVRKRRKFLDLSQIELASAMGVSFQQLQKYEKGQNRFTAAKLRGAAKKLKISVQELFSAAERELDTSTEWRCAIEIIATIQDIPEGDIIELLLRIYPDHTHATMRLIYKDAVSDGWLTCLAWYDGEVVGVAVFKAMVRLHSGLQNNVDSLAVKYDGRGIGRQLCQEMERFARQSQCSVVELNCRTENDRAQELYRKSGMHKRADTLIKLVK